MLGGNEAWWCNLLNEKMNYQKWKGNSGMLRLQFKQLVEMIGTFAKEISNCFWKDFVSFDNRVALTLYYLKGMGSMRMKVNTFGIACCTASIIYV